MVKTIGGRTAGKNFVVMGIALQKKIKIGIGKKNKIKNFLERHLLCMRLFAVYFRGL